MGIQIVGSVPHFFQEFISQSDQNSDQNSGHIINQIFGASADISRIKNNSLSNFHVIIIELTLLSFHHFVFSFFVFRLLLLIFFFIIQKIKCKCHDQKKDGVFF